MKKSLPQLIWSQRQRKITLHLPTIYHILEHALMLCLEQPRYSTSQLPKVIEITFLNDRAISQIHAQFLQDPTTTDVITFAHSSEVGEILLGIPTIAKNAHRFQEKVDHEVARCVIHGLLHLLDYDDTTSKEYQLMHTQQEAILKQSLDLLQKVTLKKPHQHEH